MSDPNPSPESPLDKAIADVLRDLEGLHDKPDAFAKATDQLVKLHRLKIDAEKLDLEEVSAAAKFELERQQQLFDQTLGLKPKPLSRDTLVLAGANLLGIVLIVGHERANVVTSKAIGFIKTLR